MIAFQFNVDYFTVLSVSDRNQDELFPTQVPQEHSVQDAHFGTLKI